MLASMKAVLTVPAPGVKARKPVAGLGAVAEEASSQDETRVSHTNDNDDNDDNDEKDGRNNDEDTPDNDDNDDDDDSYFEESADEQEIFDFKVELSHGPCLVSLLCSDCSYCIVSVTACSGGPRQDGGGREERVRRWQSRRKRYVTSSLLGA